jgi:hypothetical protein
MASINLSSSSGGKGLTTTQYLGGNISSVTHNLGLQEPQAFIAKFYSDTTGRELSFDIVRVAGTYTIANSSFFVNAPDSNTFYVVQDTPYPFIVRVSVVGFTL